MAIYYSKKNWHISPDYIEQSGRKTYRLVNTSLSFFLIPKSRLFS